MARSAQEIVELYPSLRMARGPELEMAFQVKQAFNGDIVLPVTELHGRNERAGVANLLRQGINQAATRAGGTLPSLWCPPTKPGVKKSEAEADVRRRAHLGWWEANDFKTKQYRRLRHFVGYASTPVMIRPDFKRKIPKWCVLDPLSTFPAPSSDPDCMTPEYVIFAYRQTLSELRKYHNVAGIVGADKAQPNTQFECLEYVDDEHMVLIVLGRADINSSMWTPYGTGYQGERFRELIRLPNLARRCTVIVPGRVTLDRRQGQFDGMLPMFIRRARLEALSDIAVERRVFENEWFVESDAGGGEIVQYADGREGIVGHVKGGTIQWHTPSANQGTDMALDRMERQERIEGPIPAEYGGESASNVRTDRRGNTILGVAIDPGMQETHDLLAQSYREELQVGVAVDKGWFGDEDKSFYVNWKGATGPVTYRPNKAFAETDQVQVRWSMPGSDMQNVVVTGGQRVGMGTLSKRGFMEIDPLIDDVEEEHDRVVFETLEQSILDEIRTPGSMPLPDKARVMELVVTNRMELAEAIAKVQRDAQERQATPTAPTAPEAQPGVVPPGMGAEAGTAPIAGPTEGQQGLASLVENLRSTGRAAA